MNNEISALSNTKSNRIYYFDVIRSVACLSVIMLHTSKIFVIKDIGTFNFWLGNILNSFAGIGVPLFVMISGALMLDENYDFRAKKNVSHIIRLIIFFVFWSFIYCILSEVIKPLLENNDIQIKNIIYALLKGPVHLWFIPMIVGLYLLVPLLRLWVKIENESMVKYFLLLAFFFTYIIPQIIEIGSLINPVFENANDIMNDINMKYVGGYIGYFVLGWYLNKFEIKRMKVIIALGIVGLLFTIVGTYFLSIYKDTLVILCRALTINILFYSIMIFSIIKVRFSDTKPDNRISNKLIIFISKYSLGIYAIHAAIIKVAETTLPKIIMDNAYICIPIVFIVSFGLSVLISYILKKIPLLNRLV